jgi:Mg-chelatase subunit ChlI
VEQKGNKKIKVEKPIEVDDEDSQEEAGSKARRRSSRISQARHKQKSNRFWVEEVNEESSDNNKKEDREEDEEEEKEEVGKSMNSEDNYVDNIQTQVSAGNKSMPITLCEESRKMDTSPITISSLAKDNLMVFTNPRVF